MDEMVLGELTARFDRSTPGSLSVDLTGRSASREAEIVLAPLFERIAAAARDEGRAVVLRFDGLRYFNSSTIAALLQFIRTAEDARLALEIVYDDRQRWQAMSFDALRRALRPQPAGAAGPGVTFRGA